MNKIFNKKTLPIFFLVLTIAVFTGRRIFFSLCFGEYICQRNLDTLLDASFFLLLPMTPIFFLLSFMKHEIFSKWSIVTIFWIIFALLKAYFAGNGGGGIVAMDAGQTAIMLSIFYTVASLLFIGIMSLRYRSKEKSK